MPFAPLPLLVLHADAALCDRVVRAAPDVMEVTELPSWEVLRAVLPAMAPGTLLVVDPYHGQADGTLAPALRGLLAAFPRVPVLAATPAPDDRPRDALTLGAWGVAELLATDAEDVATLSARLHHLHEAYFARVLRAVLPDGDASARGRRLGFMLHLAAREARVGDVAGLLRLPPRALTERNRRVGLPAPPRLLAWLRLLLAADLLDCRGHTLATAALACGYPRTASLRRAVQRLVGMDAVELVERGGVLTAVGGCLARELAELEAGGGE